MRIVVSRNFGMVYAPSAAGVQRSTVHNLAGEGFLENGKLQI
jgi:hypothetical protein